MIELKDKSKHAKQHLTRQIFNKKSRMTEMKSSLESGIADAHAKMQNFIDELVATQKNASDTFSAQLKAEDIARDRMGTLNDMADKLRSLQDNLATEYNAHKDLQKQWEHKSSEQEFKIQDLEEEVQDLYETVHMSTPQVVKKYWTKNATRGGTP